MTVRDRHSVSAGNRRRTLVIAALCVALCGCAHFASSESSSGVPAASSPSGVERNCGGADADACDRIVQAAVRAGSVDGEVTAVQVTTEHAPSFGPCPSGPCPSLFPDLWAGAVVTLRSGERIDMGCNTYVHGEEDLPAVRDFPMLCAAVKEAEQHIANLYAREVNASGTDLLSLGKLSGTGGNMGAIPSCGFTRLSVPFSFYLSDYSMHAPSNEEGGGGPVGEFREVFRSEDIGNREGNLYLEITVLGPDEVRVKELKPFTVEECSQHMDTP